MAITTASDRIIKERVTRFAGYIDGTSETIVSSDCWLTFLAVHNTGSTDATFTLSDRSGTPVAVFSLYRVTGSATDRDTVILSCEDGLYLPNGFTLIASTGAQLHARGIFKQ